MSETAFPVLPLLNDMVDKVAHRVGGMMQHVFVVGLQHLLPTTGSLLVSLIRLGVNSHNIFVVGKCYSSCQHVRTSLARLEMQVLPEQRPPRYGYYREAIHHDIQHLWDRVVDAVERGTPEVIVLLDDGGYLLASVPNDLIRKCRVVAVDQTTSGLTESSHHPPTIPVIDVARSAVKAIVEPTFIADAIVSSLPQMSDPSARCGIIGLGQIGQAVASALTADRRQIFLFDTRPVQQEPLVVHALDEPSPLISGHWCQNANEVLQESGVVFGCAGADVFPSTQIADRVGGDKILASCSSGDVEFRSLLRAVSEAPLPGKEFDTVTLRNPDHRFGISILNGGFPVNFDRQHETESPHDIQLTRTLLLGAFLQAIADRRNHSTMAPGRYQLSAQLQEYVIDRWQPQRAIPWLRNTTRAWTAQWIREKSRGQIADSEALTALLE